jgi:hypothetical protein
MTKKLTLPEFKTLMALGVKLYVDPDTVAGDRRCWLHDYWFNHSSPIYAAKLKDTWWFYGRSSTPGDNQQGHGWEKAEPFLPHLRLELPDYYARNQHN